MCLDLKNTTFQSITSKILYFVTPLESEKEREREIERQKERDTERERERKIHTIWRAKHQWTI